MNVLGRRLGGLVLLGILCTFAEARQAPTTLDKLHPHMIRLLEERGPSKGWVFFEDKGLTTPEARSAALERALFDLHPRALERRRVRRSAPGADPSPPRCRREALTVGLRHGGDRGPAGAR